MSSSGMFVFVMSTPNVIMIPPCDSNLFDEISSVDMLTFPPLSVDDCTKDTYDYIEPWMRVNDPENLSPFSSVCGTSLLERLLQVEMCNFD